MKKILILLACLLPMLKGMAYDFKVNDIYYRIFATETGIEAEVTYNNDNYNSYSGEVVIPGNITHGEKSYKVTSIAYNAFKDCINLTSVIIGENINKFSNDIFSDCTALKEIIVSDNNPQYLSVDGILFNKDKTELIIFPNAKSGTYTIPNSVTSIRNRAFYGCTKLTSITIPEGITSIYQEAFYGCVGLTSINIPNSITILSDQVFRGCTNLKKFVVSNDNPRYSAIDGVLYNKNKTKLLSYPNAKSSTYTVPDGITSIGDYAFSDCIGLTSITIPNSVIEIGNSILSGCRNLQKLSLPFIGSSIKLQEHLGYLFELRSNYKAPPEQGYVIVTYGRDVFGIYSYYIPLSLTEISVMKQANLSCRYGYGPNYWYYGVFNGCSNLKVANLPLATSIGNNTFSGCKNLKDINLPIATSIGEKSFYGCTNLKDVSLPSADFIGKYAFQNCYSLEVLSLPVATSTEAGFLDNCDKLQIVLLPKVRNIDILRFPKSLISLNIGSLKSLSSGILSNSSNLEELTIPFVGTGVKETAAGIQGLFGDLFGTSSNAEMKATTQYYQDNKAKTYYLPANLRKVTVTEECEELQYGAFYGCSTIKEITLPYTLYMVGEKALYGCAGLTDIYCKGAAPAAAYDNSFTGIRVTTCKLHIPYNTTNLYKASDGWKKFFYMQEEAPLTVNVTKNILNAGIILGITEYQQGAMVNLSARANSGYRFKCWMDNGEIVSEEDNYSFTINENKNLLAVFIPVQNENSLIINTESNAVNFTWKTIDDTNEYILKIYSDIDMKKEIASYQFDAKGELVTRTASKLSFRVTDLKPEVTYYYSLIANDKSNKTLSEQIGTFSTTPTGIEDISTSTNICIRVEDSSLWIENAQEKMISVYNLQGVCQTVIHKAKDMEMIQIDHSGIYLIKVDKLLQKVIIK